MNEQTIAEYVKNNLVASTSGRRCVDGRYETDQGSLARPGGDFGYVMMLLELNNTHKLGLTPEQCIDKVFQAVSNGGQVFSMHTDQHASEGSIGCGHIAKAMVDSLASAYGVSAAEVSAALAYLIDTYRDQVRLVNLPGEHKEKAVLVVTGTEKTVNPNDGENMFFVYDRMRDEAFSSDLLKRLGIPGLSAESLLESANRQTNATLSNLAHGLPIFAVNADRDIRVNMTGVVG